MPFLPNHQLSMSVLMTPDMANTPARRIYFALQTAYIGDHEERMIGLQLARDLIGEFREATTSNMVRDLLDSALHSAEADQCYQALKLARRYSGNFNPDDYLDAAGYAAVAYEIKSLQAKAAEERLDRAIASASTP
jgi:flagellar protein FlbT